MASGLLLLLDDIATILDDVAVLSKVAAKKTAGVLGDDLALNAQQVAGVKADRELPVVWAVAKGSFVNKLILVPLALIISVVAPALINPLLMIGGLFLCFEGVEKLVHSWHERKHKNEAHNDELQRIHELANKSDAELVQMEKDKIKGAIRTDFILSAEIVVISLGTVAAATLTTKIAVLSTIAIGMTIGVYGLVAMIVKIDDFGIYLTQQTSAVQQKIGNALLAFAPMLMKTLSVVGTLAMFLVGGGIVAHVIPQLHHFTEHTVDSIELVPHIGMILGSLGEMLINFVIGLISGTIVLAVVTLAQKMMGKKGVH
ncbi:DUF808 domain-containing protein [Moraxella sp. ZY210820]|uniref:DUF808 domain-containing protein n=1 Tax=unclassified Moraxella TaxID=2685852 RepID=UPI002730108C|nr:DUF808 domain-containing protein [Moraxella sp. ZY210820]WLF84037.1 DUF808 domain-containing protein [Moraxella sp. ZY210820]